MRVIKQALQSIENAVAWIRKEPRNYYRFGEGDSLPNYIILRVNDSGTARECIDKLQTFIYGNGFADPNVGDLPANAEETFNKYLQTASLHTSYSDCVTARVLYDNSGNPARIYSVPWQTLRRIGNDSFVYNPLMGDKDRRTNEDKYLRRFKIKEPPAERLDRMARQMRKYGEQFGDIVYYFNPGVGRYYDVYSVPKYYSGIEDIESDIGVTKLERKNVLKGWRTQVIISTGPIDRVVKDENGDTAYDRLNKSIDSFVGDNAAVALLLDGAVNEAKPEVKTIPVADMLDQTEKATERIGRKVCRHMGVPPVLVGFATAGQLGNVQEMQNTMELFKLTVIKRQDLIRDALKTVWPEKNFDISPLTLFTPTNEAAKV